MSGGGLKVGDLYVSVSASIGEMVKTLRQAVDAIEDAADDIEGHLSKASAALGDMAEGLLSMAGLAAAAFVTGAESSKPMKDSLDELTGTLRTLSVEVGSLFTPLVKEMTAAVKYAVAYWRNLDDGLKATIVSTVRSAAVFGGLALALSRAFVFVKSFAEGAVVAVRTLRFLGTSIMAAGPLFTGLGAAIQKAGWALVYLQQATVGDSLAKLSASATALTGSLRNVPATIGNVGDAFRALGPKILAVGLPVLALTAAVAALVLLAGSLYKNWDDLKYLVSESTAGIVDSLSQLGETAARFFSNLWSGFKGFILSAAAVLLEQVASKMRAFARFLAPVTSALKMRETTKALQDVQNLTGQQMVSAIVSGATEAGDYLVGAAKESAQALADQTKNLRKGIVYGLKSSADGAAEMGLALKKALGLDELMSHAQSIFGRFTDAAPTQAQVAAVGTTGTTGDTEKKAEELAKAIQEISGGLLEAARVTGKWQAETAKLAREGLASVRDVVGGLVATAVASYESSEKGKKLADAIVSASEGLLGTLRGRLGEVTSFLDTAIQGFTAGGPLGGALAMLGDLLTRSEGFQALVEMLNEIIQAAADALGGFLVSLQPLMGAVGLVVDALFRSIGPLLNILGEALQPLVPILVLVAELLGVFEPVIALLTEALKLFLLPLNLLKDVIVNVVFVAIKYVALGFLYVAKGLATAWNGILGAIQGVFRALGSIKILGGKPLGFLNDWADSLEGSKLSMDGLNASIAELNNMTRESATAKAQEAAAVLRNREALDKATESLTNVPSGWKVALARFDAQNARGASPALPASTPGPPMAPVSPVTVAQPAAPAAPIQIGTINVSARDEREALSALERKLDDMAFRARGSRGQPGRYANGGL
jgi:hypothetical protein